MTRPVAVRFGIIGCGVIGRYHAQAAADSPDDVAREVAELHGVLRVYTDAESLIADDSVEKVHARPISDLAGAIREQRPAQTSLERTLVIQRITDAIYASADRGTAVSISS